VSNKIPSIFFATNIHLEIKQGFHHRKTDSTVPLKSFPRAETNMYEIIITINLRKLNAHFICAAIFPEGKAF
jgi:hypothetical protein